LNAKVPAQHQDSGSDNPTAGHSHDDAHPRSSQRHDNRGCERDDDEQRRHDAKQPHGAATVLQGHAVLDAMDKSQGKRESDHSLDVHSHIGGDKYSHQDERNGSHGKRAEAIKLEADQATGRKPHNWKSEQHVATMRGSSQPCVHAQGQHGNEILGREEQMTDAIVHGAQPRGHQVCIGGRRAGDQHKKRCQQDEHSGAPRVLCVTRFASQSGLWS